MKTTIIATGDIITDETTGVQQRVVSVSKSQIILTSMESTTLEISKVNYETMMDILEDENISSIKDPEAAVVFDKNELKESVAKRYEKKLAVMTAVEAEYGPTFMGLTGKKPKPALKKILKEYDMSPSTFWPTFTRYIQSGRQPSSLVDKREFGTNKGKIYKPKKKAGRKSELFDNKFVVTDTVRDEHFAWGLKEYVNNRELSMEIAYTRMLKRFYVREVVKDGKEEVVPLPDSKCPTFRQFKYYLETHLTAEDKKKRKTSESEVRNNDRVLVSDSLDGVNGPGDLAEVDACEADVSLVSMRDPNKTIGRPVVYFLIDVFTRCIIAAAIALDNNSVVGVTNLFLNLADDKVKFCERYGVVLNEETKKLWPSNILPRQIRCDRGAEFKSKDFTRICNELGVRKDNVTGASGSLKGVVEQSFHQMHRAQNAALNGNGLITDRYDSDHHREATLNLRQYTKMVINFILSFNEQYMKGYQRTRDMIDKNVMPVPALLWEYGVGFYGEPRPIPNMDQYMFTLMQPMKATLSRKGLKCCDLYYYTEDDAELTKRIWRLNGKTEKVEVRMDPRSVAAVYYVKDHTLRRVPLNDKRTGNAEFADCTLREWKEYQKAIKEANAKGEVYNRKVKGQLDEVDTAIVESAKKATYSDPKDMRVSRSIEQQEVAAGMRMYPGIDPEQLAKGHEDGKEQADNEEQTDGKEQAQGSKRRSYGSFEEGIRDIIDNS